MNLRVWLQLTTACLRKRQAMINHTVVTPANFEPMAVVMLNTSQSMHGRRDTCQFGAQGKLEMCQGQEKRQTRWPLREQARSHIGSVSITNDVGNINPMWERAYSR
jgi:hypothetical protein